MVTVQEEEAESLGTRREEAEDGEKDPLAVGGVMGHYNTLIPLYLYPPMKKRPRGGVGLTLMPQESTVC